MNKWMLFLYIIFVSQILFACGHDALDKPIIQGVQEGEVYGNAVKITLKQKQKDVEYKATIDGEEYFFGSSFDEEGKHTLTVTAARDDMLTEENINFEINTTPPSLPSIKGIENNGVYFENVTIEIEKEKGIEYTHMIDGVDYKLNTPYSKVGKHIFTVIATNTKNNLRKEKNINFTIDNNTYTQKEVDYFTEIALGSEYGGSPYIKKWISDIKIKVGGNPTKEDIETLENVVKELNDIISTIQIDIVDKNENINMYFVPQGEFRKYIPSARLGNWAYFSYYTKNKWEIEKAIITIGTFGSNQKDRNHHIREELTQALGMGNDSPKYKDSIFHEYEGESLNQDYSELDKKVIELLYREDINLGMNKEEILKRLSKRIISN